MKRCYSCGTEWKGEPRPGFRAPCPRCEAYIRVCVNCEYFDRSLVSGCRLTTTEPVREKEKPNFCEEFQFVERSAADSAPGGTKKAESARDKFDKLFKKPPIKP